MFTIDPQEASARFERTLDLLRDPDAPFTAEVIYSLTDLADNRLVAFREVWDQFAPDRRRSLIARLAETAETNFELDFSAIINPALDDPDPQVRQAAIEGVLEDSPPWVIERLIALAQEGPLADVRAAAARALGPFVLRGELGKLAEPLNRRLQDTMLDLYRDLNEDLDVRRRALEAVANCGRTGVSDLIREAYFADDLPMRVSAVFAMGRSCDDVWLPQIVEELSSEYPEMRYEAARAAGELELRPALRQLAELAFEGDVEIQEMAIWAIGEIGGKQADQVLTNLAALAESTGDDELAEAVAEAQAAALLAGEDLLPLFDFSDFDDDDEDDDSYLALYADEDDDEDEDDDDDVDVDVDDEDEDDEDAPDGEWLSFNLLDLDI